VTAEYKEFTSQKKKNGSNKMRIRKAKSMKGDKQQIKAQKY
jgi:hypothetical protein